MSDLTRVSTSFGPVALVDEGPRDAPALVMLHGSPGSHRDFRHLAPHLVGRLRVLRLDLPGFGESPRSEPFDPRLTARARVVPAVLDALGIDRAAVLGHSMGGGLATAAVVGFPPRACALVLLASVGPYRHRGMRQVPPPVLSLFLAGLAVPGLRDALLPRLQEGWRRARFPNADRMTVDDFRFQLTLARAIDFGGHAARLARVTVPTLVAWTDDDHLVEPAVSRALLAAVPGAHGLPFETGGHNLQKTRAEAVGAAILELLSPVASPRSG